MTTANQVFLDLMATLGVDVDPAVLPGPDTPLPPTNATLHVLDHETGYGTPERAFFMVCGVSWKASQSSGEHKYFFRAETYWHKHVNCSECRKILGIDP